MLAGSVLVQARPDATQVELAVVRAEWAEGCRVDATQTGREVDLVVTRPPGRIGVSCKVSVVANVPPGLELDLATASGDVAIGGVSGRVTVDVGVGDVRLADVSGPLALTLGTGDVVGSYTGERLEVSINSGQLRATGLRGTATAAVGVGKLELTWDVAAPGDNELSLGAGTLIARYPAGTAIDADLDTTVGSVKNALVDDDSAVTHLVAHVTAGSVRILSQ